MNHQPEIEVKITAFLLGELPPDETADLQLAIERDPELAKLQARLQQTIDLVRETSTVSIAHPAPTPLRLSEKRREALLQQFKTIRPKEFQKTEPRKTSWVGLVAGVALVMLLAAISMPNFVRSRSTSPSNAIINNMRLLDGAKQQWAMENKKTSSDVPTMTDLAQYMGRGGALPGSIAGEKYIPGPVGEAPSIEMTPTQAKKLKGESTFSFFSHADQEPAVRLSMDDYMNWETREAAFKQGAQKRADIPAATSPVTGKYNGQFSEPAFVANNAPGIAPPPPAPGKSGNVAIALPQSSARKPIYQNFGFVGEPPNVSGQLTLGDGSGGGGGRSSNISQLETAFAGNEIALTVANGTAPDYEWKKNGRGVTALTDSLQPHDDAADKDKNSVAARHLAWFEGDEDRLQSWDKESSKRQENRAGGSRGDGSNIYSLNTGGYINVTNAAGLFPVSNTFTITSANTFGGETGRNDGTVELGAGFYRLRELEKQRLASVEAQHSAEKTAEWSLGPGSPKAEDFVAGEEPHILTSPKQSGDKSDLATRDAKEAFVRRSVKRKPAAVIELPATVAASSYNAPEAGAVATSTGPRAIYQNFGMVTNAPTLPQLSDSLAEPELSAGQASYAGWQKKNAVASKIQESKQLYEAGKFDEAEAKLNDVLKTNPSNGAANYYLGLTQEAREINRQKQPSQIPLAVVEKDRLAKLVSTGKDAEKAKVEDAPLAKSVTSMPEPQPEILTRENPFSTFSLNVSDVSFKLAGASLEKGMMPEAGSIRSEEFINAFDYRDPEPSAGVPVAFAAERARYPFAHNRALQRISLKTAALGRQQNRPLNIVLLLDNSGSMERADRQNIIRAALRVLATQLHPQDTLSVVTFARTARLWVDGVSGDKAGEVAGKIGELTPQGGTNLEEAMNLAYETALRHYLSNGINRVVLLTDGAANLGNVDAKALKQKVEAHRQQGVALDCFGIGWEGYNDDLLEVLSRNGDGRYAFINSPEEVATEFAAKLAGALQVAAADVKVQVEFNTNRVTSYRQIGYAKHQLTKEQFRDNKVDAAEIGAAEAGNALYVIEENPNGAGPIATVRVRFKVPGTGEYQEHEWIIPCGGEDVAMEKASPALKLAMSASAFSEWLAGSPYAGEVTADRLLGYLQGVPEFYGADGRPKKLEWMIRQAKTISGK